VLKTVANGNIAYGNLLWIVHGVGYVFDFKYTVLHVLI